MSQEPSSSDNGKWPIYSARSAADYLDMLDSEMRASFTEDQLAAVHRLLAAAIPKQAPKLVDLGFSINLLASRYYIALYVGKDRRRQDRGEIVEPMARKGNAIIALAAIIGLNMLIGAFILLIAYVVKSLTGYSFLPPS